MCPSQVSSTPCHELQFRLNSLQSCFPVLPEIPVLWVLSSRDIHWPQSLIILTISLTSINMPPAILDSNKYPNGSHIASYFLIALGMAGTVAAVSKYQDRRLDRRDSEADSRSDDRHERSNRRQSRDSRRSGDSGRKERRWISRSGWLWRPCQTLMQDEWDERTQVKGSVFGPGCLNVCDEIVLLLPWAMCRGVFFTRRNSYLAQAFFSGCNRVLTCGLAGGLFLISAVLNNSIPGRSGETASALATHLRSR